jgi:hypothetical protein
VGRMCRIAKTTECTSLAKRSRCVSWTWLTLSHLQSGHHSGDSGLSPSANPPVPESLTPSPQIPPRFCLITRLAKCRAGTAAVTRTGHGWVAWLSLACRRKTHDTLQICTRYVIRDHTRPLQGPLLPESDVNLCPESCFYHKTSIAKRFKAVAWRRPK